MRAASSRPLAERSARRGDFPGALAAALGRARGTLRQPPDFQVRPRDPSQDLQYGGSLRLCAEPGPYLRARAALRLAPRCAEADLLGGIVEAFLARFRRALFFLDRAAVARPHSWVFAWRGVARALQARQRRSEAGLREALADLDRAIRLGPAESFALPWRAELRHDLEDMKGALRDLERVLASEPSNPWARVERGEILCEMGRHGEAMAIFAGLVREYPQAWAYALRGRTLAMTSREEDALADLRKAVELDPGSSAFRAWLSEGLRRQGRYAQALAELDRAIRLDPRFVLAWIWRGRIRLVRGKPREALRDLDRAARLDARYRLAFAWRGEALFKLGRTRQAVKDFERMAPMDPMRTWNPVLEEGQPVSGEARRRAYWRDLSLRLRARPRDPWALRLWRRARERDFGGDRA